MYGGIIKHAASSGEIEINVRVLFTKKESLYKYEDKEKICGLCKDGCNYYGRRWSCPPFSPSYREFADGYENVLIVLYYSGLNQFGFKKSKDEIINYSHSFLKSQIDELMYALEKAYNGISILNGHCLQCDMCACEEGHSCKKPDKMRYSMESLGLDVTGVSSGLFRNGILWYAGSDLPEHSTILSCLLTNDVINEKYIGSFAAGLK